MTLRLTEAEIEALRLVAEREHRSMQDVARQAIREYTSRRTAVRDAALSGILAEDAELLDRLAK